MNIFTIFFLILAKYSTRTHQIAPFFKIFSGEHAPERPSKRVAKSHALHGASRHANTPTFPKIF